MNDKNSLWTVLDVLRWTSSYLISIGILEARLEVEILLSGILSFRRLDVYLNQEIFLSSSTLFRFVNFLNKRIKREPLAYILENKEFWSIDVKISKDVLIPRSETECLVKSVIPFLAYKKNNKKILDLGTGSGIISFALAREFPEHYFYALDISPKAIVVAIKNSIINKLNNKIKFLCGNWMNLIEIGSIYFDLIISNPPYIRTNDIKKLDPEVRMYEPLLALDGGVDGLYCLREILNKSFLYLKIDGILSLEIGYGQVNKVKEIAIAVGKYKDITVIKDYGGIDRIIQMKRL